MEAYNVELGDVLGDIDLEVLTMAMAAIRLVYLNSFVYLMPTNTHYKDLTQILGLRSCSH